MTKPDAIKAADEPKPVAVRRLFERANAELVAGRSQAAEATCREIIALDDTHSGAWHLRGIIALRAGEAGVSVTCQLAWSKPRSIEGSLPSPRCAVPSATRHPAGPACPRLFAAAIWHPWRRCPALGCAPRDGCDPVVRRFSQMRNPRRKIGFVLAASDHGTMIVNRFDYRMLDDRRGIGVGFQILDGGSFDPQEVDLALWLLGLRRRYFGDGVMALDCGANIGAHTIEWAKRMSGWGWVLAIEAQERVFYALAGNIAVNNCFNARAIHAAVAAKPGRMRMPAPDYLSPGSFGSLELRRREGTEFIGQPIDYSDEKTVPVGTISLDSLALPRIDLIKIDIEGMELEAIEGAVASIARCRPILIIESIKSDKVRLQQILEQQGYRLFEAGLNLLAVHYEDKTSSHVKTADDARAPGS
jgi:FkbM family methyltransferase